jgi:hypothetical protein
MIAVGEEPIVGGGEEDARCGEQHVVERAEGGHHHRGRYEEYATGADEDLRHIGGDET